MYPVVVDYVYLWVLCDNEKKKMGEKKKPLSIIVRKVSKYSRHYIFLYRYGRRYNTWRHVRRGKWENRPR